MSGFAQLFITFRPYNMRKDILGGSKQSNKSI